MVLNAGRKHGVVNGSVWYVDTGRSKKLALQIVEVRHVISAGIVVEGRIQYAAPGLPAKHVADYAQ